MNVIASLTWDPAMIAGWLFAGLAAGWLTGKMTEEASYGALGDMILGGIGGLSGGLIYGYFRVQTSFWDSILVAFVAAGLLIGASRMMAKLRSE